MSQKSSTTPFEHAIRSRQTPNIASRTKLPYEEQWRRWRNCIQQDIWNCRGDVAKRIANVKARLLVWLETWQGTPHIEDAKRDAATYLHAFLNELER